MVPSSGMLRGRSADSHVLYRDTLVCRKTNKCDLCMFSRLTSTALLTTIPRFFLDVDSWCTSCLVYDLLGITIHELGFSGFCTGLHGSYPLVMTNRVLLKMAIEIVSFPMTNCVFPIFPIVMCQRVTVCLETFPVGFAIGGSGCSNYTAGGISALWMMPLGVL